MNIEQLFDLGFEYRTIGCNRSEISAYHECVGNKPVDQNPYVCFLPKGVFNQRPSLPKCLLVWEIQTVLDFTKNQWLGCETLSDKILIYKVVISMALSSGSRASAIHHPSLKFCEYA